MVRSGKFIILYKRPGHRVLINASGDLIVRPSYVEASVRQRPGDALRDRCAHDRPSLDSCAGAADFRMAAIPHTLMLTVRLTEPEIDPDPPPSTRLISNALARRTAAACLRSRHCKLITNSSSDVANHVASGLVGGSSVAQHLLLSYQASFLEIMRAQFSEKAYSGGSQVRCST